jgi:hypothetical protein
LHQKAKTARVNYPKHPFGAGTTGQVNKQIMNANLDATSSQPKDLIIAQKHPEADFTAPNLQKTNSWLIRNKALSPEFNNVEDEAELGNMMGNDGEKLLELVDDIRKIDSLRNEELHIPQVLLARMNLYMSLT